MSLRCSLLLVLFTVMGCLDTHEASLGEQEADGRAPEAGRPTEDGGPPLSDGGPAARRDGGVDADDDDDSEHADAATSLLCRLEPWHCL